MSALTAVFAAVLGALIGSFANVVIYRLPRGESIAFPGSHCPHCGRHLAVIDLVPVLSYLALGGRCRTCKAPISPRYPLVEALMAGLFVVLTLRWPPLQFGAAVVPLLIVVAMLVMAALIDLERFILPDVLVLPALLIALGGSLAWTGVAGLPGPRAALIGALAGAGVLVLINRIGALVLRRFGDTNERLWPLSLDQTNVAAVAGAVAGVWPGLIGGGVSALVNLVSRRILRLPEPLLYGLWLLALVLSVTTFTVQTVDAVAGSVLAAGAWALLGAGYWWLKDSFGAKATSAAGGAATVGADATSAATATAAAPSDDLGEEDDEPVAMGFGDVKLAAVLGALLGWERLLVGIFLAVTIGAVGGIIARLGGGQRLIPFGPYLLLGAVAALFFGDAVIAWYLGLFAV